MVFCRDAMGKHEKASESRCCSCGKGARQCHANGRSGGGGVGKKGNNDRKIEARAKKEADGQL